jgi:putative SOS response-associated peptidase YedK
MCGRAKLPQDVSEIKLKLDLRIDRELLDGFRPRWNAAPTTDLPVVRSARGERSLVLMRWGLIPSWAKDKKIGASTYNARAERIDVTPAFRSAWKTGQRCLVVADGYYEWRKADKQPFAVALGNRSIMTFAGLWDAWRAPDGGTITSFTIITTQSNALLASVHDRMPVLLAPDRWPTWLGESAATGDQLKAMLKPYPSAQMAIWPVGKAVGNVRNDHPDLFEPLKEAN